MSEEQIQNRWIENPMNKPRIEKVTINIGVGKSGEPLERASTILEKLTGQNPGKRKAKKTIRDFGIRKGEPIACLVSLRGERAEAFLKKVFPAVGNRLKASCFDFLGNFSFGIKEHIEIPGVKYVPELGIFGMDVSTTMGKLGYRVKRRKRRKSKVGSKHVMTRNEAIFYIKEKFSIEIGE